MDIIYKIKKDLQSSLSKGRYEHSLRVAMEAKKLAHVYYCDEENAYIAGLIHDVAKEFTREENLYWIRKCGLSESLLDDEFPRTIHAVIGAIVAREKYHLNEEICQSICYHSVANVSMSLLDKIVFVADKIEPGKNFNGIEEERELAYQNIDEALILCLRNFKLYCDSKNKKMHPESLRILNLYSELSMNEGRNCK